MNEEALHLARLAGDEWNVGNILYNLGDRFRGAGDVARAEALYRESAAAFRAVGDCDIIAFPIGNLGRIAFGRCDDDAARAAFEESITIAHEVNNASAMADWHLQLARVALRQGDFAQAQASLATCLQTYLDLGNNESLAEGLVVAADLAQAKDDASRAAVLLGAADRLFRDFHFVRDTREHEHAAYWQQCLQVVRTTLGEAAFVRYHTEGQSFEMREAILFVHRHDG